MVCRILVAWPGNEPTLPAVEAQSFYHWTAREVPVIISLVVALLYLPMKYYPYILNILYNFLLGITPVPQYQ